MRTPSIAAPGLHRNRRYHGYFRGCWIPSSFAGRPSLMKILRAPLASQRSHGAQTSTAFPRGRDKYQRSTTGSLETLVRAS